MSAPPLRIAHVVNEPFSPDSANGVQQVICCLARSQAEIGHAVAVFSRDDHARYVLGEGAESRPLNRDCERARIEQLASRTASRTPLRTERWRKTCWRGNRTSSISTRSTSRRTSRWRRIFAASERRTASRCTADCFAAALRRRRVKKAIFNLVFERRYLNDARVHPGGESSRGRARSGATASRHGVVVIPNGLPPKSDVPPSRPAALFEAHPSLKGRRVFMFVGRLDPWQKGLDLLVEAFARAATPRGRTRPGGPGLVRLSGRVVNTRRASRHLVRS